jgi:hypothetical protein
MSETRCPNCGKHSSGNFCGNCGTPLKSRHCTQCGAELTSRARFCTQCGANAAGVEAGATRKKGGGGARAAASREAGTSGGDPNIGWWAAGGLLILLITVVAWPVLRPDQVAPVPTTAPAATGPAAVDLNSMTPRQAADRLYERVMLAASAGDSATAVQFLPMAIQAYDRARPLDSDGLFHLSSLQRTAGDLAAATATAAQGLADDDTHLLLLYAAGQAAAEAGDAEAARGHYQRILDVYDAEMASGNPDYDVHDRMMGTVRSDAVAYLGGGGA